MTEKRLSALETEPLGRLIVRMAIPGIAAQIINLIYNVVDRIYVGHIKDVGTNALGSIGVCFPVLIVITAFAFLIGTGGATRASIAMGEKRNDVAEKILGNCFTLTAVMSVLLMVFFYLFRKPVLVLFGATDTLLPLADEYITMYLVGTFSIMLTIGLNPFITNQGFATTSMCTTLIGTVINIALDPIFIFGLHMGVRGAALATILAQTVSAVWILLFLQGKKSVLHIKASNLKVDMKIMAPVLAIGLSPFMMNITEGLVQMGFNQGMRTYGNDMYISVMSILFSINQAAWMPLTGFAQGVQPIIGYNYGAKNYKRVWKSFYILFAVSVIFCLVSVGLVIVFPKFFLGLFTNSIEFIEAGAKPLSVFMIGMLFMGAQSACQNTFVGLGQAKQAIFIACLRKVILLWPLSMILPRIANLGLWGVFISEPVSDVISATVCVTLFFVTVRKLLREEG